MDIETLNAVANLIQIPIVVGVLIWMMKSMEGCLALMKELISRLLERERE